MESYAIPRAGKRPLSKAVRKLLLISGLLSSLIYVIANVICVLQYEGYNVASQTVSELSAIGAPTRQLWVSLMIPYSLLGIAFGFGIWRSNSLNLHSKTVGILFIAYAVIGFFWPPMHMRETLAAGGGTISDTLHIVFTIVAVPMMMFIIGLSVSAFGRGFRLFSLVALGVMIVTGIITGIDGPKISANLPTPWIGIWERICIAAYILWVAVLSIGKAKTDQ